MAPQFVRRALAVVIGVMIAAPLATAPGASAADPSSSPQAGWTATGSLTVPRERAAGVLLNNGKVLVAGGQFCDVSSCTYYSTADLYDPATGFWTSGGFMSTARTDYQMVLLPNGKALAIGGTNGGGHLTADLYGPSTNSWSSGGSFSVPRDSGFQAVVMATGKVLVVGGCCVSPGPYSADAEIYNPATNSWSSAPDMSTPRYSPTAELLPNGKVLVAGGLDSAGNVLSSSELYNPATNSWSPGGTMVKGRWSAQDTSMINGKVIVVGGVATSGCSGTSEVYNPTTNSWGTLKSGVKPRSDQTATPVLVNDGKILVQGGNCNLKTGALYNSSSNTWAATPNFNAGRRDHVLLRLRSGKVLAAGGDNFSSSLSSAELFTPNTAATAYATTNPVVKGSSLTVAGSGFQAGETVNLSYKGAVYASGTATGSGTFSITFDTSTTAPKAYIDLAQGASSGRKAYFPILVTAA